MDNYKDNGTGRFLKIILQSNFVDAMYLHELLFLVLDYTV